MGMHDGDHTEGDFSVERYFGAISGRAPHNAFVVIDLQNDPRSALRFLPRQAAEQDVGEAVMDDRILSQGTERRVRGRWNGCGEGRAANGGQDQAQRDHSSAEARRR